MGFDAQGTHNRFEMVRTIIYDKDGIDAAQAMTAFSTKRWEEVEIKVSMLDSSIFNWRTGMNGDGVFRLLINTKSVRPPMGPLCRTA